jgi:hypothetical protein
MIKLLLAACTAMLIMSPARALVSADPAPVEKQECFSMEVVLGMTKDSARLIARLEDDPFKVFKTRVADKHQGRIPDEIDGILILRPKGSDDSIVVGFSKGCQVAVFLKPNKTIDDLLEDSSI